jgi:hypothetical protein
MLLSAPKVEETLERDEWEKVKGKISLCVPTGDCCWVSCGSSLSICDERKPELEGN